MSDDVSQLTDRQHAARDAARRSGLTQPPRRHKTIDELTAGEHLARERTHELPETDEYRRYVADVHEAAGLGRPADTPKTPDEMNVADHLARIKRS